MNGYRRSDASVEPDMTSLEAGTTVEFEIF